MSGGECLTVLENRTVYPRQYKFGHSRATLTLRESLCHYRSRNRVAIDCDGRFGTVPYGRRRRNGR